MEKKWKEKVGAKVDCKWEVSKDIYMRTYRQNKIFTKCLHVEGLKNGRKRYVPLPIQSKAMQRNSDGQRWDWDWKNKIYPRDGIKENED